MGMVIYWNTEINKADDPLKTTSFANVLLYSIPLPSLALPSTHQEVRIGVNTGGIILFRFDKCFIYFTDN